MNNFKKLFHRNSVKIFNTLERLGVLKLTRSALSYRFNPSTTIPLWYFLLTTPELHKSNDWYGHATILKKYTGLESAFAIKGAIEHGPFFGEFIFDQDLYTPFGKFITFSKKRAFFLEKKLNKKAFAIGPYIHYAEPHISASRLKKEKQRLGKSLLVFPVHSTSGTQRDFDSEEFCQKIINIGKRFDTIRVCVYWRDIFLKTDKVYRKYGFEIVTAGHVFDPHFLPRLKTFITLSAQTMSNAVGTHIGYCTFMKKPHYLYRQKIATYGNKYDIKRGKDTKQVGDYKKIEQAFSTFISKITKSQLQVAQEFYGFDQVKTPLKLRKILTIT